MDCKVSIEEKNEVDRSITIDIPRALYNKHYNKELSAAMGQAKLKGFRPGKAPKHIVDKMYGERIRSEVLSRIVSDAYQNAVNEHSLNVIGNPQIDIKDEDKEKDLKVVAEVSIFPEPEVKDYHGVSVEVGVIDEKGLEKEIKDRTKRLPEELASLEPLKLRTTVQKDDIVQLNFEATVDGKPFKGSSQKDGHLTVGEGKAPKDLEEGLIGAELNQQKEILVQLPDDYPVAEVAGKKATYLVTVSGLYERVVPELTDEFVKEKGIAETVLELNLKIRETVTKEVEERNNRLKEDALLDQIAKKNEFKMPQALIDEEIRGMLFEFGMLDPKKRESYQISMEGFRESSGEIAEQRARRTIILSRIVEQEKIDVSDQEIDAWIDERALEQKIERKEFDKLIGYPKNASQLKSRLVREKLLEKLLTEAKIKEVPLAEEKAQEKEDSGKTKKKTITKKKKA